MIRIVCDGKEHAFRSLPITIGRDDDNDLPVDDSKLSRHHCRICRTPEGIAVEAGPRFIPSTGRTNLDLRDPDGWRVQLVQNKDG